MPNNPIQVILNTQNYVSQAEVNPGGNRKDFYENSDTEFSKHKVLLLDQVEAIMNSVSRKSEQHILLAKVSLQRGAIAKSHRPIKNIFNLNKHDYVGGSSIDSMLVEINPSGLDEIHEKILSAEDETTWVKDKSGKTISKPSVVRSEVGSIQSISAWSKSDRRKFSIDSAVQWLSNKRTGHSYYVDLFYSEDSVRNISSENRKTRVSAALSSFWAGIENLNLPLKLSNVSLELAEDRIVIITIAANRVQDTSVHVKLVRFLENHDAVRHIYLPSVISSEETRGSSHGTPPPAVAPNGDDTYPVIGIVDTGVAEITNLNAWSSGKLDFITDDNQNTSHGTFIAGLITASNEFNSYPILNEKKCKFFDLGLHPTVENDYEDYYPRGFIDFLEQLDAEIIVAKAHGVRIFNMSLSVTNHIDNNVYSLFADLLDKISDKHNIIFVLPAGNLDGAILRDEWPNSPNTVLAMIANYRHQGQDCIYQPGDSIRALVVGATDPADTIDSTKPAQYSRRGPGPSLGAKPDIAHIGGMSGSNSGLKSLTPDNLLVEGCGTSYAAPLAAKTLAMLNHDIQGEVPREALLSLLIHNSIVPKHLDSTPLRQIRKDFIGAGIPLLSEEILLDNDHQATLLFNGIIKNREELDFQFTWPSCLTSSLGACKGRVKLTLVYSPPIDRNFDGEFARVNIDAFLRQEEVNKNTGESIFKGRLQGDQLHNYERDLVKHGSKWWPVKVKKGEFRAKGTSSQWKLVLKPLTRANFLFPAEGVPFSVVFTVTDKSQRLEVFQEMRAQLLNSGVQIAGIRNALRPQVRQ